MAQLVANFAPFLWYCRDANVKPRILNFFKGLRSAEGKDLRIGVAGFCWGGRHTVLLAHDVEKTSDGRSLIDAAYTAHPSMLSVPADINAIKLPISMSLSTADGALPLAKAKETESILNKKDSTRHEIYLGGIFEGAKHGFAIRGDPKNEKETEVGMAAEDQAVSWFLKQLVGR